MIYSVTVVDATKFYADEQTARNSYKYFCNVYGATNCSFKTYKIVEEV